jgi:hypothetical protein
VGDVEPVRRFLRSATAVEVVDTDPYRAGTTLLADVSDEGVLEPERFEAAILTTSLDERGLGEVWRALVPGGVLWDEGRRAVKNQ